MILKDYENNGKEEIDLVTHTPGFSERKGPVTKYTQAKSSDG